MTGVAYTDFVVNYLQFFLSVMAFFQQDNTPASVIIHQTSKYFKVPTIYARLNMYTICCILYKANIICIWTVLQYTWIDIPTPTQQFQDFFSALIIVN